MKQTARVLDYIDRFGSITALEVMRDLGIMRLASRVFELREMGYKIIGKVEIWMNRFNEPIHYMRYQLED